MSIRSHLLRLAMLACTLIGFIGIAATANATTFTGTMKNPDGSNFNGVIYFTLSSSTTISSASGCGGPIFVPNTYAPIVSVVNGVPNNSINLYDSECMNPAGLAYNVAIVSNTGSTINEQWVITGTSENIGSIVPVTQTGYVPEYVTQIVCDSTMSCTPSSGIGTVTLHANGTGGGGGGAGFPSGEGIVYALTTTTSRLATSSDIAGLLNTSPSTVLSSSLLPDASSSSYGAAKCDGTTITCTDGVFTDVGSSMVWPAAAGIMVYGGSSAYGTSLTAPSGTIVGTTDTQTLTNKTLDGITPTVFGYLDATSSIQTQINSKQASLGYTPAHSGANSDITSLSDLSTPLSIAQGGTGTATPTLTAGSNVTITGTWPNQTISASGGGGGSGSISGLTAGCIPLAATATTITDCSNIDDGETTLGTVTIQEPVNITGGTPGIQTPMLTLNGGTPLTSQSSSNSEIVTCETGGSPTQVCDAAGNWISASSNGVQQVASSLVTAANCTSGCTDLVSWGFNSGGTTSFHAGEVIHVIVGGELSATSSTPTLIIKEAVSNVLTLNLFATYTIPSALSDVPWSCEYWTTIYDVGVTASGYYAESTFGTCNIDGVVLPSAVASINTTIPISTAETWIVQPVWGTAATGNTITALFSMVETKN